MANELPPTLSEEAARLLDEAKTRVRAQLRPKISDAAKLDAAADMAVAPLKAALKKDPNLVSMGGKGAMEWLQQHKPPVIQAPPPIIRSKAPVGAVPPVIKAPPVINSASTAKSGAFKVLGTNKETIMTDIPPAAKDAAEKVVKTGWLKTNAAKLGNLINRGKGYSPAIAAGGTVLTACLWPSKKEEVTKDDGTMETKKKWGFGKKTVVTVGAIISAALITHKIGPVKGWLDKVLGSKAIVGASRA